MVRTTGETTLSGEVAEALQRLGRPEVPEIVEALATAVERGHHIAALAAEGSGREALYALACAHRCDPEVTALQALVLAPTADAAERIALAIRAVTRPAGLRVRAAGGVDDLPGGAAAPPHVLAGPPGPLLTEVRSGRLRLADLRLLVVDGAAALDDLEAWDSVEAILDTLPSEAGRIVVSDRLEGRLEDLLVRQLPRARRWPPELFEPAGERAEEAAPILHLGGAAGEGRRLDLLAGVVREALDDPDGGAVILGAGEADLEGAAAVLETRGIPVTWGDGSGRLEAGATDGARTAVLYGTPSGLPPLREALGEAERRVAIVPEAHVRWLELLAARAGWRVRPLAGWSAGEALEGIRAFRRRVRDAAEAGDLASELLVLEPLLAEYGPERVAAALGLLLRRRAEAAWGGVRPWPDVEAVSGGAAEPPAARAERGVRPAWTRLWIGVGKRDQARPADLVGAITGETGIVGGQIGKIEIRGSFSLVDIDSQVVDEVIRGLDGVMIRGRPAVVRIDRGG